MEPILPSGGPTSPASVMLCAIEEILPYVEVSLFVLMSASDRY